MRNGVCGEKGGGRRGPSKGLKSVSRPGVSEGLGDLLSVLVFRNNSGSLSPALLGFFTVLAFLADTFTSMN